MPIVLNDYKEALNHIEEKMNQGERKRLMFVWYSKQIEPKHKNMEHEKDLFYSNSKEGTASAMHETPKRSQLTKGILVIGEIEFLGLAMKEIWEFSIH